MKKVILFVCAICLFLCLPVTYAAQPLVSKTTYEQTADEDAEYSGKGALTSVLLITDGANDATLIIYDTLTVAGGAAGSKLCEVKVAGGDNYGGIVYVVPQKFNTGLSFDVTGTGASYIVNYIVLPR